jgi:putative ABC transport system permease protein
MGAVELLLLRRFAWRHCRLTPGQSALLVLILALGVGVFISIRLANQAAVASFTYFTETLTGQSDWIIQAPAGTLPATILPELRRELGALPVHLIPVVEATASAPPAPGAHDRFGRPTYTLLGVDLLALANLARTPDRSFMVPPASPPGAADADVNEAFWRAYAAGPQLWISAAFAPSPPRAISLVLDERILTLTVAGVIPTTPAAPRVPANLFVIDLGQLQALVGKNDRVDRVEFIVEPGPRADAVRTELGALLNRLGDAGGRWAVTAPGARRETAATMTRAFRLNLTVLSLLALLVGLYLIFQALDGAVVRRRPEMAILRSLGVEETTLRRVWLAESAVLGLVGGALGLLLGWAGAQICVRAVGQTVNALYYNTSVASAQLTLGESALGLGLGLGAALLAGWWPAREAARTLPAQILQRSRAPASGNPWLRSAALGSGCLGLAGLLVQLPPLRLAGGGRFPLAGYAAAFLGLFGGGIICAFLLPLITRATSGLGRRQAAWRVALGHLRAPSGRHRLAIAALLCAIAMTGGMAILVASFEETIQGWVERTLQADLYLASAGAQSASSQNRITATTATALTTHPAVAAGTTLVAHPIAFAGGSTLLAGTDLHFFLKKSPPSWVHAPRDLALLDASRNAALALISESFSERFQIGVGAALTLPTPSGPRAVNVVGIFADYGNERGSVLVDARHLRAWFQDDAVTNVSLFVKPGINPDSLRAELMQAYPGLSIFTNTHLRGEILRIFHQTFAITYALEIIGVFVAVIGLALTLASVLLDRREELTTLRALGFSRHELALSAGAEGLTLAVVATVGGLSVSLALGWLLIAVINKQSFGWTLSFALPWAQLAALAVAVSATGAVVSYAVGRWGAELPADREA